MRFALLGPLTVRCNGVPVAVPAGSQRAVLAALLLSAGRVVTLDELAEVLWGSGPPRSARVAVQNYVMRLRKALGDAGRARIITQPGGYLIQVEAGELDVSRFEVLLRAARAAAADGSWDAAAAHVAAALALWRGEPLADAGSEVLALREVPRLAELRLQALEVRIEAGLQLGQHSEVIGALRQLTRTHRLREHLYALLMLALYRDSRQGEALAVYQRARAVLAGELGVEPGVRLRELQQQILTADPVLDPPQSRRSAAASRDPVLQHQLPGTVPHFTGRDSELAALTRLLDVASQGTARAVLISAIGGTAGVGKTALAVHWAHQVAGRFPDGQLYVNLRGYDPGQPMTPGDALAGFLRALGVPGPDIPAETDERATRYRSLLAGRRVLVLLDNASEVEQVRPLLPATPGCVAVVTSRDALVGLVARDGAARLDLNLLPPADAVGLLEALIGERARADPGATQVLAALCCRLPLALRVAAELAAARPAVPLTGLVTELADQQRRLDLLDAGGDPRTAVRAVFSWSCRHLDPGAARAFRLAGLHPGPDFDPYAAAALTATTVERAGRLVDVLARAHLIQPAGLGRYGMHDLLRGYAAGQAAAQDGEDECRAALTRLFDHYLCTAAAAMESLYPAELHTRPALPPLVTPAPTVTVPGDARAWLDAQRATLVAVVVHTASHGWPSYTTRLAVILSHHLQTGGHYPEAITILTCARRAARHTGDHAAEAEALTQLGAVEFRQGCYGQAIGHHQQSLSLSRENGNPAGEALALNNLVLVHLWQGRYPQATTHLRHALALSRETGDRIGQARALVYFGLTYRHQGRYEQAAEHYQQALILCRETGDRTGEAQTLNNLGEIELRQGRYPQATSHLQQALALFRETGNRPAEADALGNLGEIDMRQGRYPQATSHLQQALALFRETGNPAGEAEALNVLSEVLLADGRPDHARAGHITALDLASQIGNKHQQARAHHGLGSACHAIGDPGQASRHWQQALSLYTSLGAPEADQVRASLQEPGPVPP